MFGQWCHWGHICPIDFSAGIARAGDRTGFLNEASTFSVARKASGLNLCRMAVCSRNGITTRSKWMFASDMRTATRPMH
jgi:hypothetical protein